ncbi:hypothetical protein HYW35_00720 [Candidatus Saccharibacteria bacterium]|nr:hypothetical protein [Candidatus Saccharibacteria bacterium]
MVGYNHFEKSAAASSTSAVATRGDGPDEGYIFPVQTETTFFQNGTMVTNYIGDHRILRSIYSKCQGRDLLDQAWGRNIVRSVNVLACDDGMLTPNDYPNNPSNKNIIKK